MKWTEPPLNEWAIVGMNHYNLNGKKHLFVAMTRDGQCITSEGLDDEKLWEDLKSKIETLNTLLT